MSVKIYSIEALAGFVKQHTLAPPARPPGLQSVASGPKLSHHDRVGGSGDSDSDPVKKGCKDVRR